VIVNGEVMVIKYPEMRSQVIEALRAFSDPEYQQRVWVDRRYPHENFYDDLTHNVHVLYDDTGVAEAPHDQIGITLNDSVEAESIEVLAAHLTRILDSVDPGESDASIISRPEWNGVVVAARETLKAFH
jgi:hypothetical protein